jgi:uncharacterized protein
MVEVKIDAIRVNMMGSRVVILKDTESNRYLPIWIGETEANSISIQLQGLQVARPITHDLIVSIVREMGGQLRHVLINDMRDDTYYARLILVSRDGKETSVDSRPSDAIAVAVRCDCPIYVDDDLMGKYSQMPDEDASGVADEDLGAFKDFLGSLDLDDLDKQ